MQLNPMNLTCPSSICIRAKNARFQACGEAKGNKPSMMSTKAKATHRVWLSIAAERLIF
jgi:hypothetical protein